MGPFSSLFEALLHVIALDEYVFVVEIHDVFLHFLKLAEEAIHGFIADDAIFRAHLVLPHADIEGDLEHDEDVFIKAWRVLMVVTAVGVLQVRRIGDDGAVFARMRIDIREEGFPNQPLVLEALSAAK